MSATLPVVPAAAPTLTASVCALLEIVAAGGAGRVDVRARSRHGVGQRQLYVPVEREIPWVPAPVLELLEDDLWAVTAALAVLDDEASRPVRLGAVVARLAVPAVFRNPEDPASDTGRQWIFDGPALAEACARLVAFLPPTAILDARTEISAVWALTPPLDVRSDEAQGSALALHHELAAALNGTPPAEGARVEDLAVPLPGSVVRELGSYHVADCIALDRARVYAVEDVEAAIEAACAAAGRSRR